MSVYSGFATRQLEGQYNKLITQLLKILQRRIVKFYRNEKADELQFKKVVEETLTKLNQMEHQKYNEPYISAIMDEMCDLLQIAYSCQTGCVCSCHQQLRKSTFITSDNNINSNPSSCKRQTVSSMRGSVKGVNNTTFIGKSTAINQIQQISHTQRSQVPYYIAANRQNTRITLQNTTHSTNFNTSFDKNYKINSRIITRSPPKNTYKRIFRSQDGSRANPNESFEERKSDRQNIYGQTYQKLFSKKR